MEQLASLYSNGQIMDKPFSAEFWRCMNMMICWWLLDNEWGVVMFVIEFEPVLCYILLEDGEDRAKEWLCEATLSFFTLLCLSTVEFRLVLILLPRVRSNIPRYGMKLMCGTRNLGNAILSSIPEFITFLRQAPYSLMIDMIVFIKEIPTLLRLIATLLNAFIHSPVQSSKFLAVYAINFTYIFFLELRRELFGNTRDGLENTPLLIPVVPKPARHVFLPPLSRQPRSRSGNHVQHPAAPKQDPLHVQLWQKITDCLQFETKPKGATERLNAPQDYTPRTGPCSRL